jgi:hypothetical protein
MVLTPMSAEVEQNFSFRDGLVRTLQCSLKETLRKTQNGTGKTNNHDRRGTLDLGPFMHAGHRPSNALKGGWAQTVPAIPLRG